MSQVAASSPTVPPRARGWRGAWLPWIGVGLAAAGAGWAIGAGETAPVVLLAALVVLAALATRCGVASATAIVLTALLPVYGAGWFANLRGSLGLLTVLLLVGLVAAAVTARGRWRALASDRALWLVLAFGAIVVASLVLASAAPDARSLAKTYVGRSVVLTVVLVALLSTLAPERLSWTLQRSVDVLLGTAAVGSVLSIVQVGAARGYLVPPDRLDPEGVTAFVGQRAIGFAESAGTWAAFLGIAFGLAAVRLLRRPSWLSAVVLLLISIGLVLSGLRTAVGGMLLVGVLLAAVTPVRLTTRVAVVALVVAGIALPFALTNFRSFVGGAGAPAGGQGQVDLASLRPPAGAGGTTDGSSTGAGGSGGGSSAPDATGMAPFLAAQPGQASARIGQGRLSADESAFSRYQLTRAELETGLRHPVTGVGLGQIGPELARVRPSYIVDSLRQTGVVAGARLERHNTYAGLFAELGVPGLACFLALFVVGLLRLRSAHAAADPQLRIVLEGLGAALVMTAVIALFTETDRQVFLWWTLGLAVGAGAALRAGRSAA